MVKMDECCNKICDCKNNWKLLLLHCAILPLNYMWLTPTQISFAPCWPETNSSHMHLLYKTQSVKMDNSWKICEYSFKTFLHRLTMLGIGLLLFIQDVRTAFIRSRLKQQNVCPNDWHHRSVKTTPLFIGPLLVLLFLIWNYNQLAVSNWDLAQTWHHSTNIIYQLYSHFPQTTLLHKYTFNRKYSCFHMLNNMTANNQALPLRWSVQMQYNIFKIYFLLSIVTDTHTRTHTTVLMAIFHVNLG